MNDRSAKVTKDGKISVKLPLDEWEIILLALRARMTESSVIDAVSFFLLEETALKLYSKKGQKTIRFRKSEFFVLFDKDTFSHIKYDTYLIVNTAFEKLRKDLLSKKDLFSITK